MKGKNHEGIGNASLAQPNGGFYEVQKSDSTVLSVERNVKFPQTDASAKCFLVLAPETNGKERASCCVCGTTMQSVFSAWRTSQQEITTGDRAEHKSTHVSPQKPWPCRARIAAT